MNVGSLFSGIGGLDLGLERAGMTVRWQSEIDPYACRVLAKHWPHVPNLGDITLVDWSTVEPVDLICGGYPCQPFSLAGVRRGDTDPRHLWPHFHRAIRDLRPRYAFLENVPGHLSMGFDRVLGDLAEIGYDVEWCSIPAAAVGAPHLRWRLFAVAYPRRESEPGVAVDAEPRSRIMVPDADPDRHGRAQDGRRMGRVDGGDEGEAWERERTRPLAEHRGETGADPEIVTIGTRLCPDGARGERRRRSGDSGGSLDVANTEGERRRTLGAQDAREARPDNVARHAGERPRSHTWATEPDVGRVAHGVPSRVDRLRCLGNAVVPQVAEWIGRRIMEAA